VNLGVRNRVAGSDGRPAQASSSARAVAPDGRPMVPVEYYRELKRKREEEAQRRREAYTPQYTADPAPQLIEVKDSTGEKTIVVSSIILKNLRRFQHLLRPNRKRSSHNNLVCPSLLRKLVLRITFSFLKTNCASFEQVSLYNIFQTNAGQHIGVRNKTNVAAQPTLLETTVIFLKKILRKLLTTRKSPCCNPI
jgi:hypothetical protein